jgi:RNAse (barnase) inhibitor barstar
MEPVHIDLSAIRTRNALHKCLAAKLHFHDYYGNNWDAFDECIANPAPGAPRDIEVFGIATLKQYLPGEAELLLRCLELARQQGAAKYVVL